MIYRLFQILKSRAKRYGGEVHHLFGNHEGMNLCGDYSGLSKQELRIHFNNNLKEWKQAWSKSGYIGQYVRENFEIVKVLFGRLLFVHAGLAPPYGKFTPEELKAAFLHRIDEQRCEYPRMEIGGPPANFEELKQPTNHDYDMVYGENNNNS